MLIHHSDLKDVATADNDNKSKLSDRKKTLTICRCSVSVAHRTYLFGCHICCHSTLVSCCSVSPNWSPLMQNVWDSDESEERWRTSVFLELTTSPAREYIEEIASSCRCRPSGVWLARAASSACCKSKILSFVTFVTACKRRILNKLPWSLYFYANAICSRDVVTKNGATATTRQRLKINRRC